LLDILADRTASRLLAPYACLPPVYLSVCLRGSVLWRLGSV